MRTLEQIFQGEDKQTFLMNCYLNPKIWCERVLGLELSDFHLEWLRLVQKNKRVALLAPTGHGKTEILAIAYPLWIVWFNEKKEILIISKDMQQSTKILERIKSHIEENELLRDLIPSKQDTWTKTEINTSTKCKIFCKSFNQKETLKSYHVDYLIADEAASYEDPQIFFRYIVTRVIAKRGTLVCISTPVSITDLMSQIFADPKKEYVCKKYPAIINGVPLWKEKFTLEDLNKIKNEIGTSAFEREYLCNPKAQDEETIYPPGMIFDCFDFNKGFRYQGSGGDIVIGCDFAISSGTTADYDCYIVVEKVGDICMIIWGEVHKGMNIQSKVIRLKELYNIYKPKRFIVDESQIGAAVIEELRKEAIPVDGAKFDPSSRNTRLIHLRKMLELKKISIPRDPKDETCIRFTDRLVEELIKFREVKTKAQTRTYQSSGAHDDTVMALSLAISGASQIKKALDLVVIK